MKKVYSSFFVFSSACKQLTASLFSMGAALLCVVGDSAPLCAQDNGFYQSYVILDAGSGTPSTMLLLQRATLIFMDTTLAVLPAAKR